MRALAALAALLAMPAAAQPVTALALVDPLQLPPGFTHFPSANPDAPKGGTVTQAVVGTFDSFNPFIVRGTPDGFVGSVYDPLMAQDVNEAFAMYCHLCETVEVSADKLTVTFTLRPAARFNDGTPVLASDVVWTFNALRSQGRPQYRSYYADVDSVTADGDRRAVFHLKTADNRELPLILGQLQILPEHWWKGRDFGAPLTDAPLGSGPYTVAASDSGRSVTYQRVKNWWAADLPTARGLYNFDTMRFEYFRDPTVAFEAFKAGQVDFRQENIAKRWATEYDFPAMTNGLVKRESLPQHLPTGMQAFAMNSRRALFADPRVREALTQVFDFQWMNKNLFYDTYTRTESYFSNSEFASSGLPTDAEAKLLEPFRAQLPPQLFTTPFALPVTDGSGNNRAGLLRALDLLKQAGWTVKDRKLVNAAGDPFSFELLLDSPSFERVGLPYVQWLSRLGIDAHIRTIDASQFQKRMDAVDFDMAVALIPESESLGNEQADFWTCASAKLPGTQNVAGICNPAVDALVAHLIAATDRNDLLTTAHALDRVLLWNWYMVPQWHSEKINVAYWNRFGHPTAPIKPGIDFTAWWVDPALAAATDAARAR